MTGFRAFLIKDLREIARTWRIWVLPAILLLLAVTGPLTARFMKEIFGSVAGAEDILAALPDPTWVDSYAQWTKNLAQLVPFVLVIMLGSAINGERRAGTAVMVLTKPVSRLAFVLAKFVSTATLVVATTTLGAGITLAITVALFPGAPAKPAVAATAVWLVLALLLISATLVGSALVDSGAGASGIGLGFLLILGLLGLWPAASRWSPAGLAGLPGQLGAGQDAALLWPVVTGLALTAVLVGVAVAIFRRREL